MRWNIWWWPWPKRPSPTSDRHRERSAARGLPGVVGRSVAPVVCVVAGVEAASVVGGRGFERDVAATGGGVWGRGAMTAFKCARQRVARSDARDATKHSAGERGATACCGRRGSMACGMGCLACWLRCISGPKTGRGDRSDWGDRCAGASGGGCRRCGTHRAKACRRFAGGAKQQKCSHRQDADAQRQSARGHGRCGWCGSRGCYRCG